MRQTFYPPGWPMQPPRKLPNVSAIQVARIKWQRRYKKHHRSNRRYQNQTYGNIGHKVRWWLRKQQGCRKKQLRFTPGRLDHKGPDDIKQRLKALNPIRARLYWAVQRGMRRDEALRQVKDRLRAQQEPMSAWDRGSCFEQPANR